MSAVSIAVFASGTGSNLRNLYAAQQAGEIAPGYLSLVISDKPDSKAVAFAREVGLPVFAIDHKEAGGRSVWERMVIRELHKHHVTLVVLAGYMRLVGLALLESYQGRMINLHPSLLPAFKGLDAIGQAFEAKVAETGVSVHYVTADLDGGPLIAQKRVPILPEDTIETLTHRIHEAEHEILPKVVRMLCQIHP